MTFGKGGGLGNIGLNGLGFGNLGGGLSSGLGNIGLNGLGFGNLGGGLSGLGGLHGGFGGSGHHPSFSQGKTIVREAECV